MSRTLTIKLSKGSINTAIRKLNNYRNSIDSRNYAFTEKLFDAAEKEISSIMGSIAQDEVDTNYSVRRMPMGSGGYIENVLEVTGDDIAFIEFSSGITHGISGSQYPLPSGSGYGVGTYPGQRNANNPDGWYFSNGMGLIHTYGVPAYKPMYYATVAMRNIIFDEGRKAFKLDW